MLKLALKAFGVFLTVLGGLVLVCAVVIMVPSIYQIYRAVPDCSEDVDPVTCSASARMAFTVVKELGVEIDRAAKDTKFVVVQEVGVGKANRPTWRKVLYLRVVEEEQIILTKDNPRFRTAFASIEAELAQILKLDVCGRQDTEGDGDSDLGKFVKQGGAVEYAVTISPLSYNLMPQLGRPAFDRFQENQPPKASGLMDLFDRIQVTIGPVTLQSCEDMP